MALTPVERFRPALERVEQRLTAGEIPERRQRLERVRGRNHNPTGSLIQV